MTTCLLHINYNSTFFGPSHKIEVTAKCHKLRNLCYKGLIPIHQSDLKCQVHMNNSVFWAVYALNLSRHEVTAILRKYQRHEFEQQVSRSHHKRSIHFLNQEETHWGGGTLLMKMNLSKYCMTINDLCHTVHAHIMVF